MGSLNAAETLRVDGRLGAVAPGKQADLCLVPSPLEAFVISEVVAKGRLVVQNGSYCGPEGVPDYPVSSRATVKLSSPPDAATFAVPASSADGTRVRVIEVHDGSLITNQLLVDLPVRDGAYCPDPSSGINKVASFERHGKTGRVGLGFVAGYGLLRGAVASTYNPHCQHLICVGADDRDMALAAAAVAEMGGGFAVVRDGTTLATVPLPLYGLLSDGRLTSWSRRSGWRSRPCGSWAASCRRRFTRSPSSGFPW